MAQPYNIGNLGQVLTVNLTANIASLSTTVNAAALSVGSAAFIANSSQITIGTGIRLSANGGIGSVGQVLTSNGTSPYWASSSGGGGAGSNIFLSNYFGGF